MEEISNSILLLRVSYVKIHNTFIELLELIINTSKYNTILSSAIRYGGMKNKTNGGEMK